MPAQPGLLDFTINDVRRALRKVRDRLLDGRISKEEFDMGLVLSRRMNHCGTVGCIGGHMATFLRPNDVSVNNDSASSIMAHAVYLSEERYENDFLEDLFYEFPRNGQTGPKSAAKQIDRYLDGKQPWPSANKKRKAA